MSRWFFFEGDVKAEWIDEFGHMNYLDYQRLADVATMAFWDEMNGGRGQAERGGWEFAIVDVHARYLREVRLGDRLAIGTGLVRYDQKSFGLLHELRCNGTLCASVALSCLSFHLGDRRVRPFDDAVLQRFAAALGAGAASGSGFPPCLHRGAPAAG